MTTDFEVDGEREPDEFGEAHAEVPPAGQTPLASKGQVPLAALQAERGRRQAAERERDELLARLPGGTDARREEEVREPPAGDGRLDPAGALSSLNEHLNASEAVARQSHGDAAVDAAEAWAERAMRRDPALAAEILSHPDPYAFALGYALSASGQAESIRMAPPRSLTSAPSAGGVAHVPAGPGQAYDSLFGGR